MSVSKPLGESSPFIKYTTHWMSDILWDMLTRSWFLYSSHIILLCICYKCTHLRIFVACVSLPLLHSHNGVETWVWQQEKDIAQDICGLKDLKSTHNIWSEQTDASSCISLDEEWLCIRNFWEDFLRWEKNIGKLACDLEQQSTSGKDFTYHFTTRKFAFHLELLPNKLCRNYFKDSASYTAGQINQDTWPHYPKRAMII